MKPAIELYNELLDRLSVLEAKVNALDEPKQVEILQDQPQETTIKRSPGRPKNAE